MFKGLKWKSENKIHLTGFERLLASVNLLLPYFLPSITSDFVITVTLRNTGRTL